jgi:16S rRNA (cytidine1402-2'-O)-methyltransferase
MAGTLYVVATPIGNLEDITARALRILREVSLIAAEDTRRTAQLLARYAITTRTTSLHEHNETRKSGVLLARLKQGEHIALVSDAGTPTVSDPGAHLIRAAIAAGFGSSPSLVRRLSWQRSASSGLGTEHSCSWVSLRPGQRSFPWFRAVRDVRGTVVFFEAPHRIRRTLTDLQTR